VTLSIGVLAIGSAFCLAALLGARAAMAAGHGAKAAPPVILVTLGKPSEFRITLSRVSAVAQKVTFKVRNKGKKPHSFKICSKATKTATANACDGVGTKLLKPGQAAILTVFLAKGAHEYLSSSAKDAKAGMKGAFTAGPVAAGATTASTIAVTLSSPDEYSIALSKGSVGFGDVTFNVMNKGKKPHSFKVCTDTTYSTTAFNCPGKATKALAPGESAVLVVNLVQGIHEYLSDVSRDSQKGMRGGLDVIEVFTPDPVDTGAETPCAVPKATTIDVTMFEYGFTLSDLSIPCGTVTFNLSNTGTLEHDFNIARFGGLRAVSETLGPGTSGSLKVVLDPGSHAYICDIANHAALGQSGSLKVLG